MKKYNLLLCLFITIFSCNQNTNQINPIKPPSNPIINNSITNSSKESDKNKLIQIENPDYKNIDLSNFNKNIYLIKDNEKYDSKRSYQEYIVVLNEDDIYIKPSILISNKEKFIQDNDFKNFKFQSLSDNAKVDENGFVIVKEKTDYFEVEITHTPSNFKEIFKVTLQENKSYLDYYGTIKFYGDIFTPDNRELFNVNIFFKSMDNIKNVDPKILSDSYYTENTNKYLFKKAITGSRLIIIASKKGYSTRVRTEVLKSGIPDPQLNKYDFSTIYALQKEPEINYLEINGKRISSSSDSDVFMISTNNPKLKKPTIEELSTIEQIKGVGNTPSSNNIENKNLEVKMCFSEEVDKKSVEDNFRIQSQYNINGYPESELIDKNNTNLKFEWYKKKFSESIPEYLEEVPCVKLSSDSYLKPNLKGEEARYLIDFKAPFQDLEGNKAIDRRYFRFSPSQINDFAVFSIINSEFEQTIKKIEAINNETSNDIIKIHFNSNLKIFFSSIDTLRLKNKNLESNKFWYRDYSLNLEQDNATILGFTNNNIFYPVYMIGRIDNKDISIDKPLLKPLGINKILDIEAKQNENSIIKNVDIKENIVTLELNSQSFNKNDAIVLSIGKNIYGNIIKYNQKTNALINVYSSTIEPINYYKFKDLFNNKFLIENKLIKPDSIISTDSLQMGTYAK